jgi:hypothetical protein
MAYKMTALTDHVRAGRLSNGDLDIEVWEKKKGWEPSSEGGYVNEVIIPCEAVDELFEYLR